MAVELCRIDAVRAFDIDDDVKVSARVFRARQNYESTPSWRVKVFLNPRWPGGPYGPLAQRGDEGALCCAQRHALIAVGTPGVQADAHVLAVVKIRHRLAQ